MGLCCNYFSLKKTETIFISPCVPFLKLNRKVLSPLDTKSVTSVLWQTKGNVQYGSCFNVTSWTNKYRDGTKVNSVKGWGISGTRGLNFSWCNRHVRVAWTDDTRRRSNVRQWSRIANENPQPARNITLCHSAYFKFD